MLTTSAFAALREVCGLDFPFTHGRAVWVPAIKSLHLPTKRLMGLARDYRANGFPDFDRLSVHLATHRAQFRMQRALNNHSEMLSPTSYQAAPPRKQIIA